MGIVMAIEAKSKKKKTEEPPNSSFGLFPGADLIPDYSAVKIMALETERYLAAQQRVDLVTSSVCLLKNFPAPS